MLRRHRRFRVLITQLHSNCPSWWVLSCHCSYVGVMHMEFLQYLASHGVPVGPSLTTGNGMDFLIGRLSYTFGLTGPCLRCGAGHMA